MSPSLLASQCGTTQSSIILMGQVCHQMTGNVFTNLLLVFTGASLISLFLHHITLIILNIILHHAFNLAINWANTVYMRAGFIDMTIWAGIRRAALVTGFFMACKSFLLIHGHIVTGLWGAGGSAWFVAFAFFALHCANTLIPPFHRNPRLRASLGVGRHRSAETLTVPSNIASACVKHAVVKIWLKRNLCSAVAEHFRFQNSTFFCWPQFPVGM